MKDTFLAQGNRDISKVLPLLLSMSYTDTHIIKTLIRIDGFLATFIKRVFTTQVTHFGVYIENV